MSVIYADTSALIRAYLPDEPDHSFLASFLLQGEDPVVTSELARLEFTSAVSGAARGGRAHDLGVLLGRFDADCGEDGPLTLVRLKAESVLRKAQNLVREHSVRALDAIHLAVALSDAVNTSAGDPVVFVTRDKQQAAAARSLGLDTA